MFSYKVLTNKTTCPKRDHLEDRLCDEVLFIGSKNDKIELFSSTISGARERNTSKISKHGRAAIKWRKDSSSAWAMMLYFNCEARIRSAYQSASANQSRYLTIKVLPAVVAMCFIPECLPHRDEVNTSRTLKS